MATTTPTAPRAAKIHVRAGLALPTNRARGMMPGPLNHTQFRVGKEAEIAFTAGLEYLVTRLLRDAHAVTKAGGRERVVRRDVRRALDRAPHVYKPVLGDALALTGAGVTVHFEPDAKPMLRAAAGSRRRRLHATSRRGTAAAQEAEAEADREDDSAADPEDEPAKEAEESSDLSESSSVSSSSSVSDSDSQSDAPPARTTRRRATKKQLATAAAKAAKAKKAKTKKAAAPRGSKKRAAQGVPRDGKKSPSKRARK